MRLVKFGRMRIRVRMRPVCVFFICAPNSFLCLMHMRTYGKIRIREKYAEGTVCIINVFYILSKSLA